MPQQVDYDLTIIGSTNTALKAAMAAARQKLRVALVLEQPLAAQLAWHEQALRQQLQALAHSATTEPAQNLADLQVYARQMTEQLVETYSPAALGMEGVDVVVAEADQGEFYNHSRREVGFTVANRQLRARAYLLASTRCSPPASPFFSLAPANISQHWRVQGNNPQAYETAYLLRQLGGQVSLEISPDELLPQADPIVRTQVTAQLEAAGIQLDQPASIPNHTQVIDCRPAPLSPNRWNLAGMGVDVRPAGIPVNAYLQTSRPQIYACGELLPGYIRSEFAQAEARWVVRRLCQPWFYLNRRTIDYHLIPWSINLDPPLTQVGWRAHQARQLGLKVEIHDYDLRSSPHSHFSGDGTGFCQILTTAQGRLLGAAICGKESRAMGQYLALALKQRLKLQDVAELLGLEM